jgi:hypothetical protein
MFVARAAGFAVGELREGGPRGGEHRVLANSRDTLTMVVFAPPPA